jgi:hypothetical protein
MSAFFCLIQLMIELFLLTLKTTSMPQQVSIRTTFAPSLCTWVTVGESGFTGGTNQCVS